MPLGCSGKATLCLEEAERSCGKRGPAISGGAIALFGRKYDLALVLPAYQALIDALTVRFGRDRSYVASADWDRLPEPQAWPEPGKKLASEAWQDFATDYDVLGSNAVHRIGPLEVDAFLLGADFARYEPDVNTTWLSGDREVTELLGGAPAEGTPVVLRVRGPTP